MPKRSKIICQNGLKRTQNIDEGRRHKHKGQKEYKNGNEENTINQERNLNWGEDEYSYTRLST